MFGNIIAFSEEKQIDFSDITVWFLTAMIYPLKANPFVLFKKVKAILVLIRKYENVNKTKNSKRGRDTDRRRCRHELSDLL